MKSADLVDLTRVVDACHNIHGMVGTAVTDYPASCRDFVGFRLMAQYTNKHLRPCIYTPQGGRLVIEMAQVLLGGTSLRERPIVSTGFSIISPLHWTSLSLGVFKETAGFGVPVMINSEPLGGATAPVTLAGCLVIGDADTLSGLVINQLLEPARPCIYNIGFAHVIDMSSAIALTGAPENALLQAGGADLARYHNFPSASWMSTESMVAIAQAAFEKMITGLAHADAGVNFIWGAGNLESTLSMCPEVAVMDDEIAGYFLRYQRGIPVDEEGLALDLIKEVGHSADYLSSRHTRRHYRHQLSRPLLAFRDRRSIWEEKRARTYEEAAQERVRQILAAEPKEYLDAHQQAELEHRSSSRCAGENVVRRGARPCAPPNLKAPSQGALQSSR
ncbi:MAG: trimethylamine methyltransferase family protein [Ardenticatenaceae bacterium]|nr:trimethylamine methyltransferase family protein [Ardenticatenaceae bacterium]